MKIRKTKTSEEFNEYELKDIKKLEADWFVYYYESGCYDGQGFAIWKKDEKYFYSNLGHCSCYGPTDDLNSIPYSNFGDIEKIGKNYSNAKQVIDYIKSHKL